MSAKSSPEQRKSRIPKLWIGSISFSLLFVALLISSPWWHDKYFGVAQNESAAVDGLRMINTFESQYAGAHPEKGFACELSQLQPLHSVTGPYDPIAALQAGEWSGYKFAIVGCTPEANGIAHRYSVTATPTKPYSTGVRAFCTNQSGKVFYDLNGSSSQCLTLGQLLPDLTIAGR